MTKRIESIEFCGIKLNEFKNHSSSDPVYTGTVQGKYAITFPLSFILNNPNSFVVKWLPRKEGYYWIKQRSHENLEVAKLRPNFYGDGEDRWFIPGHLYTLENSDLEFISINPITYEDNEEN